MKITPDDVGINVTWRAPKLPRRTRIIMAVNVLAIILCAFAAVLNVITGSFVLVGFLLFAAAVNAFCIYVNRLVGTRLAEMRRPRPDYSLIARMEREVYGVTFHHDGAAEVQALMTKLAVKADEFSRMTGNGPRCRRCAGDRHVYTRGMCVTCFDNWMAEDWDFPADYDD